MLREDDNPKMRQILGALMASTITDEEAKRIIDVALSRVRPGTTDQFIERTARFLNVD